MRHLILCVIWSFTSSLWAAAELLRGFDPLPVQRPDMRLSYQPSTNAIGGRATQAPLLAMTISDFNADGRKDILGVAFNGQVMLLEGNQTHGNFVAPIDNWTAFKTAQPVGLKITASGLLGLESGDFDADGLADLAAAYSQGYVNFYRGNGQGQFEWMQRLHFDGQLTTIHSGDYGRRDNMPDIAISSSSGNTHLLHILTSAEGAASAAVNTQLLHHPVTHIAHGRYNDDIEYDLVLAGNNQLSIYAISGLNDTRLIHQDDLTGTVTGINFNSTNRLMINADQSDWWLVDDIGQTLLGSPGIEIPLDPVRQTLFMNINGDAVKDRITLELDGSVEIAFASSAPFAIFDVNSTGDAGDALPGDGACATVGTVCTLRAAIEESNALGGMDTITVTLAGTIVPMTPYPITDPVIIDGTGGSTVIEQGSTEGPGVGIKPVFDISAGSTTIRGLTVMGPDGDTFARVFTGDGNLFTGNFFAVTDSTTFGSIVVETNDNIIGGTNLTERNVFGGIRLTVSAGGIDLATGNRIIGNHLGVDAGGASRLGTGSCVSIADRDNEVGGAVSGSGNVITGFDGMSLLCIPLRIERFGESLGTLVQGNLIGTNATGTAAIGNPTEGIFISDARDVTIGGSSPLARNLISGNGNDILNGNESGIHVTASASRGDGLIIQGNRIGTDITGSTAIGNTGHGIFIDDVDGSLIGGTASGAGNLISGNGEDGIHLQGFSGFSLDAPVIQGNRIGTNLISGAALGNGDDGLHLRFVDDARIGGAGSTAGNVIGGNVGHGIQLENPGTRRIIIEGNAIGTNSSGQIDLGNGAHGIRIFSAQMCRIGGTLPGAGNRIAFNALAGIAVQGLGAFGQGNRITRNRLHDNVGLGIDLVGNGVVDPNDPGDGDAGPNLGQNFPEITSVTDGDNIDGSLNSTADTTFTLEFFTSTACDTSGNGEGAVFVGSTTVMTDGAGDAVINHLLPSPIQEGLILTSTAIDPAGNTSEFSACFTVTDSEALLIDGFE